MRPDTPRYRRTSWLDPRIEVRSSRIEGRGLFAREPIHAGEVVAVMGGIPITTAQLAEIIATGKAYSCAAIGEDLNLLQDADDALGYGNHSCNPNLWMRDAITIEARHAVQPNDEVTTDYALMTVDPAWRMRCQCGSRECRGVIRGDDWRRESLQGRYRGHFVPFIDERIQRLRDNFRDSGVSLLISGQKQRGE